jgi:hypothetical protein
MDIADIVRDYSGLHDLSLYENGFLSAEWPGQSQVTNASISTPRVDGNAKQIAGAGPGPGHRQGC